ncbi:hypothetical protein HK097_003358 [Rhizophlyctis rosea]|uniref:Uncharacterized protein n=1 Tax=Rhizophlyctis rosea TaxID=64517 RepID=A0AAD5SI67_9FUNG|nr:hypothetical protein HK097_003358 [Rhizophlyctis rosea]
MEKWWAKGEGIRLSKKDFIEPAWKGALKEEMVQEVKGMGKTVKEKMADEEMVKEAEKIVASRLEEYISLRTKSRTLLTRQ